MRHFLPILLLSCATSGVRPPARVIEPWPDLPDMLQAIRCAAEAVDGSSVLAAKIVDVRIVRVENYHLNGCYAPNNTENKLCQPPERHLPPVVYLNAHSRADDAVHSAIVVELLCRRRAHLVTGFARSCTHAWWDAVGSPRYAPAIRTCRLTSRANPPR
jgi:hypothetical protein